MNQIDIDQLNSVLHFDLKLVTNDKAFGKLAEELDVEVLTAEDIVIEADENKVI